MKVHVKAILRKIRVKKRTQAATWGLRHRAFAETLGNKDGGSLPIAFPVVHLTGVVGLDGPDLHSRVK